MTDLEHYQKLRIEALEKELEQVKSELETLSEALNKRKRSITEIMNDPINKIEVIDFEVLKD